MSHRGKYDHPETLGKRPEGVCVSVWSDLCTKHGTDK